MKLHNLYRKIGNKKRELVMTDTFANVKRRKDQLAQSYQRQKVSLEIEEAEDGDEKFYKPPHTMWKCYNKPYWPKKVK